MLNDFCRASYNIVGILKCRLTDTMGGLLSHMPFLRFIAPKWCNYNETMSLLRKQWKFIDEEITKHELELTDEEPRDLIEAFLLEIASRKGNDSNDIFDRKLLFLFQVSATTVLFLGCILENKENIFRREFVDPVSRSPARWDQNDERHVGDYHIIFVVES